MATIRALWLLATACAAATSRRSQDHITIPLMQHRGENADANAQTLHAYIRHSQPRSSFATAPELQDAGTGFWYGTFSIGSSTNLSLLIDTASSDVAINPGLYKPSSHSENLHQTGHLQYATTQADGCGYADIKYHTYSDTVSLAGLTASNQVFAEVINSTPPNPQTVTVFGHDGLVGFGGTLASQTQLGGTPFLQQLCDEGVVKECRFGLAYGTQGRGKQILGGVDISLFDGKLAFSPINPGATVGITGDVVYKNEHGSGKLKSQVLVLDSGTANVVGPASQVRKLFKDLGIQTVKQKNEACSSVVYGHYACDSQAKVGFAVGRQVFNIEPSAFKLADNGGNNCTATITAVDDFAFWIVGQSWFQGKYVDFQQPNKIGAASLKNKTLAE